MNKVFISGSISIKKLPLLIEKSINKICINNFEILVGDADGADTKIQEYCKKKNYSNLTIYSIYRSPRNKVDIKTAKKYIKADIDTKRERERQQAKDIAMTLDSDFSLIIWDGKSIGSYNNILRAIDNNKKTKVYLSEDKRFFDQNKINRNEIEFFYRDKNGYSAKEVVELLSEYNDAFFKNTRSFNTYLMEKSVIKKEDSNGKSIYQPTSNYKHLFLIDSYRGQIKGIKFKNEFIDWIEQSIKDARVPEQHSMF